MFRSIWLAALLAIPVFTCPVPQVGSAPPTYPQESSPAPPSDGAGVAADIPSEPQIMADVQAHTPSMIRVGPTYYWVGSTPGGKSPNSVVNMYKSNDFKDWQFVDAILGSQKTPELVNSVQARPRIIFNKKTGQYVIYFKSWKADKGSEEGTHGIVIASSDAIEGPYKVLGVARTMGNRCADITAWTDDETDEAYLVCAGAGPERHNVMIYQLNPEYTQVATQVATLDAGGEAPAVVRKDGVIFLITSGRTGWRTNQQRYRTAPAMSGPWSENRDLGGPKGYGGQTSCVQKVGDGDAARDVWVADMWQGEDWMKAGYKFLPLEFQGGNNLALPDVETF